MAKIAELWELRHRGISWTRAIYVVGILCGFLLCLVDAEFVHISIYIHIWKDRVGYSIRLKFDSAVVLSEVSYMVLIYVCHYYTANLV